MSTRAPFERVVAAHGTRVLRVCRALLDPHDADDAWSETFLAALRAYPHLPEDADVAAWLVTIAHRKAIDVLRVRARTAIPVAEPPDRPTGLGVPEAQHLDVIAALRGLPEKQRHAVAHHYLGGLPYREVGAITGQSEDAARRSGADGVRALRRALADRDEEEQR